MCVWFPDWSLRRPDAPSDEPCQVVGDDGRIAAANSLAREAGIRPGMRRREGEALCPGVVTLRRQIAQESARFEPVAQAVEELVPRVELVEPGLLFVAVSGAVRYYGGEQPLAGLVAETIGRAGGSGGRVTVADGPFLARWAAALTDQLVWVVEDDTRLLASLDVSTVGGEELVSTFRWLGVETLGDLARLPREAIASRFGPAGLEAHRLATGEDHPVTPRALSEDRSAEERFEDPIEDLDRLGFAVRSLANRLMAACRDAPPRRIRVEVEAADGSRRVRIWRSDDPLDDRGTADRVWWQLRAWFEGPGIPGGVVSLRLVPADRTDRGRQLALGEDAVSEDRVRRSLDRVGDLLGAEAVLVVRPQGGRLPGERVRWGSRHERESGAERDPDAPWPGRIPGPAPALVPPQPQVLEVEWDEGIPYRVRLGSRWVEVLSWAGPWRSTGRWWEGDGPSDRYQLVTSAGALLCEVREERSFLVGVYD